VGSLREEGVKTTMQIAIGKRLAPTAVSKGA
jgi:hypothetical protein